MAAPTPQYYVCMHPKVAKFIENPSVIKNCRLDSNIQQRNCASGDGYFRGIIKEIQRIGGVAYSSKNKKNLYYKTTKKQSGSEIHSFKEKRELRIPGTNTFMRVVSGIRLSPEKVRSLRTMFPSEPAIFQVECYISGISCCGGTTTKRKRCCIA